MNWFLDIFTPSEETKRRLAAVPNAATHAKTEKKENKMTEDTFAYRLILAFLISSTIAGGIYSYQTIRVEQIQREHPVCRDQLFVVEPSRNVVCDQGAAMTTREEAGHRVVTCTCPRR